MLSGEATAAAKDTTGIVEAIRQLSVARNSAVKARSAALCQLGDLLVTAPAALREQLDTRRTLEGKASVCAPTAARPRPPRRPRPGRQSSACAVSAAASTSSALKPPSSRANSTGWSPPQRPQPCHASDAAPTTPRPPTRRRRREHRPARLRGLLRSPVRNRAGPRIKRAHQPPPAQLRRQPRRQPSPAHDRPRPGSATANEPAATWTAASQKARPKKKPSAASNASSPASSTAPSEPTSPPSQPALDIYRNVPGRFTQAAVACSASEFDAEIGLRNEPTLAGSWGDLRGVASERERSSSAADDEPPSTKEIRARPSTQPV